MRTLHPVTMNGMPLVSLVTPAYNQSKYLVEAIESVLAQDYPNLEYVVLDDGSMDETPAILSRYSARIRCERHENMGQAATLNKGWRISQGSILGYLSSDDRLAPGAISLHVKALLDQPGIGVVYGDYRLIDAAGNALRVVKAPEFDPHELQVNLVCQPGPGAIFLRSVYEAVGGWNDQLKQVPDFDFWLRASHLTAFRRIPQVAADCRVHEDSASFRRMSESRADEVVWVVDRFWSDSEHVGSSRSRANAYLASARNHFASARFGRGLGRVYKALSSHPKLMAESQTWRTVARGVFRRAVHRVLTGIRE